MHGVGTRTLLAAFARAGFPDPVLVAEQAEPDPAFPTVAFPNPEEPGAMDLAFATARRVLPDLIIANDPDADRCAVGVPVPAGPGEGSGDGAGWRMLSGDEVGALLAAHLVGKGATGVFAESIVSSSLLGRIAEAAGLGYEETLTGFKWIARVEGLRYGYEEALGYCVDPVGVRTRTASPRRSWSPSSRPSSRSGAVRSPTSSTTWRSRTACTRRDSSRRGWRTFR